MLAGSCQYSEVKVTYTTAIHKITTLSSIFHAPDRDTRTIQLQMGSSVISMYGNSPMPAAYIYINGQLGMIVERRPSYDSP